MRVNVENLIGKLRLWGCARLWHPARKPMINSSVNIRKKNEFNFEEETLMSLSAATNEIKQVYVRQWGMQLMPPAFACKSILFYCQLQCAWALFASVRPQAIYTNLIRFFASTIASCETNIGTVKIFLHFHKAFGVFSTQQISIHLSPPEFFLPGLIPVTSKSRYDNVEGFRLTEHPHMLALNCSENCYFLWIYIAGIVNFVRCSRRSAGFIIPSNMRY